MWMTKRVEIKNFDRESFYRARVRIRTGDERWRTENSFMLAHWELNFGEALYR